ncbi:2-oxoacid:acceptor oxidoreductase [Neisseriaceae bacterium B1]
MQYEIFRAGKRKDAHGVDVNITVQDLQAAAQAYNANFHEAPLVIGHPTTNAPAFGWVEKLSVNGDVLTADFKQVDDNLVDLVRQGRYKKVSASFYPPNHPSNPTQGVWSLRHVGFLGAAAPAVKGLAAINFADDEQGVVSFSEDLAQTQHSLSRILRRLREWIVSKHGIDEADTVIPEWQIQDFQPPPPTPEPLPNFNEPEQENTMTETEKQAIERAEKLEAELAELKSKQKKAELDASHQANADFAENLVKQGCLKPADKDLVVKILDFTEHPDQHIPDFNETPLADAFKAFLQNGTTILADDEIATQQRAGISGSLKTNVSADFAEASDPKALSHHERALALQAKEGITYAEAARRTAQ